MPVAATFAVPPPARPGTLEVYVRPLDEGATIPAEIERWLDAEERGRADRLRREVDRARFVESHAFLRHVLAHRLNVAPDSLAFDSGDHGKPRSSAADAAGVSFNLSHTAGMAVVAIACDGRAVGVDVETCDARVDVLGVARSRFTARESAIVEAEPPATRARAFKRLWTRKEALHKADGRGLSMSLRTFEVLDLDFDEWVLVDLELPDGHVGAAAYAAGPGPLAVETRLL